MRKFLNKFFKTTAVTAMIFSTIIMSSVALYNIKLPESFYIYEGTSLSFQQDKAITGANTVGYNKTSLANMQKGTSKVVTIKLFGCIPIKTTQVKVIEKENLTPGGTPFGIKLFTKGVMVVDISNVKTESGTHCPAKTAGILKGDIILTINSTEVSSNEQVCAIIEQSGGKGIEVTLNRNNKIIKTILKAEISSIDGKYKGGIWVRDSSAGIGTITYYMNNSLSFAGLGHGICDSDTGKIMPLDSGEVCDVQINSVLKGRAGTPGELRGAFTSSQSQGKLYLNNESGIFGKLSKQPNDFASMPLKLKQQVKKGKAQILCTIDGSGAKKYNISIDKIDLDPKTLTKNMVITITDPELINKTGGIVQGMSGSPIIQDGELVGAVTHVFVNNPKKGYGIFAENMILYTKSLENSE